MSLSREDLRGTIQLSMTASTWAPSQLDAFALRHEAPELTQYACRMEGMTLRAIDSSVGDDPAEVAGLLVDGADQVELHFEWQGASVSREVDVLDFTCALQELSRMGQWGGTELLAFRLMRRDWETGAAYHPETLRLLVMIAAFGYNPTED
jgi:hypothetical protein